MIPFLKGTTKQQGIIILKVCGLSDISTVSWLKHEDLPCKKVVEMAETRNSGSGGGEEPVPFQRTPIIIKLASDSKANTGMV